MVHNFEGCPVFIYDENDDYITKTIIKDFHKNEMIVRIPSLTEGIERGARLTVMIVHSDGASEYNGIAREISSDMREISLFKGKHMQRRTNTRFIVNTPAVVKSVTIDSNKITLLVPQNVSVVNISKSGVLIQSPIKCFVVGTLLEIIMNVNEQDMLLRAKVKRESQNEEGKFDYGCRFLYKS